jgi:hypothetical protein
MTNWSVANTTDDGLNLEPDSGVVWRISQETNGADLPGGISLIYTVLGTFGFGIITLLLTRGRGFRLSLWRGLLFGAFGGLVMNVAAFLVSRFLLNLPWYAPPRVFATIVMGRDPVATISEFVWLPFILGLLVVVVLTGLLGGLYALLSRAEQPGHVPLSGLFYGLTTWGVLQYLLLPASFPPVAEMGFPPLWYGGALAVYGLTLGLLSRLTAAPASRTERKSRSDAGTTRV